MSQPTVASVGEVATVERILGILSAVEDGAENPGLRVGPGDDAAVLKCRGDVVLSTDSQHEGVHFRREWIDPRALGRRAIAVNASDLGAMGARPRGFLVALAIPHDTEIAWIEALARGLCDGATRFDASILGGDLTRVPDRVAINVTAVGESRSHPIERSGSRVGDTLFVTGLPGRAAAGRCLLERGVRVSAGSARSVSDDEPATVPPVLLSTKSSEAEAACVRAFLDPRPPVRFARTIAQESLVGAMMDVSDGVAIDLIRMCRASRVGARLDGDALLDDPALRAIAEDFAAGHREWVLGGGEDYELLCSVRPESEAEFRRVASRHDVTVRAVGRMVAADEGMTIDVAGKCEPMAQTGWDPFKCL